MAVAQRLVDALALFERAIALDGALASAHVNRALVLLTMGRVQEALPSADRAIALSADSPEAWNLRGQVLGTLQRPREALACFERALALRPSFAEAAANRAIAMGALQGGRSQALAGYDEAAANAPGFAAAHVNRGNALFALGRNDEALAAFERALAIDPRDAHVLVRRGAVLAYMKRHGEAAADFERARAIDPGLPALPGLVLHARANLCDWRGYDEEAARIVDAARRGACAASPLVMLSLTDAPDVQLACARAWVSLDAPPAPAPLWRGERYAHARLRVGYLSSDFDEHAVSYLLAGAIESHDRAKFETVAFHTGPKSSTPMHMRMRAAFERFNDAAEWSDADLAARIRAEEIDILVDLNGHTHGSRMRALAMRPAPVCVSWLGYPATLGAPYVDYAIADRFVVPGDARAHWSERVIDLPLAFQANDGRRPLPAPASRASAGLPPVGLVFCAFGNSYKITPRVFGAWMDILRACEGSVLWLLAGPSALADNARREAQARNVDPSRLLFAPRLPYDEHLSRLALADVFLDTYPFNGGATASDSLWCGVPIVTLVGRAMASRMAGGLLHAVGLPDLATASLEDYVSVAVGLACDPGRLASTRTKLLRDRATAPLFDSVRACRGLEAAYAAMFSRSSGA